MSLDGSFDRRTMDRRRFLGWAGMGTGALTAAAAGFSQSKALARPFFFDDPFSLGVASGDPRSDGVVLWTRLAPEPLALDGSGGMPARRVPVRWEVARDAGFRKIVRRGTTHATPELAHSVHVEVAGLQPGHEYHYRFKTGPEISPAGRTKTAPAAGAAVDRMRFAFASCQNYPAGYYTAYDHMADEDLDLVVHLGDYIYEGPSQGSIGRPHVPEAELFSLEDYRVRLAQYKTDPMLQAAHAAFPFAVTWDDHEVENNYADEHDGMPPAEFLKRRAAAYQAYYEHQPLRRSTAPRGPDLLLHRRLTYGDLAQFNLLDSRQYRSDQARCSGDDEQDCAERLDPSRTMLGDEQERWLLAGLAASPARWNVLAQQVFFAQLDFREGPGGNYNVDAWDGYVPARQRLLDFFATGQAPNPVVLTGDVHKSYVANLRRDFDDPASPLVGTEFVGTSISSGGDGYDLNDGMRKQLRENEHLVYANARRGYVRCTLDAERWRTDFRTVPFVRERGAPIQTRASFVVENGEPGAKPV